jgi:hypothetical protein
MRPDATLLRADWGFRLVTVDYRTPDKKGLPRAMTGHATVLSRGQVRRSVLPSGKQVGVRVQGRVLDPFGDRCSSRFGDLELHRPLRLLLKDDGTLGDVASRQRLLIGARPLRAESRPRFPLLRHFFCDAKSGVPSRDPHRNTRAEDALTGRIAHVEGDGTVVAGAVVDPSPRGRGRRARSTAGEERRRRPLLRRRHPLPNPSPIKGEGLKSDSRA